MFSNIAQKTEQTKQFIYIWATTIGWRYSPTVVACPKYTKVQTKSFYGFTFHPKRHCLLL